MASGEQFKCEACGQTFEKARGDAEAYAEAEVRWSTRLEPMKEAAIVCDDCHAEMLEWAANEGIL